MSEPCRQCRLLCWSAWLVGWLIVIPPEVLRFRALGVGPGNPLGFLFHLHPDSSLAAVLLLAAPLVARWGRRPVAVTPAAAASPTPVKTGAKLILAGVTAVLSLLASLAVGWQDAGLPPAYHDEYSYLFQARTFLTGHVSFPSDELAPLFNQMHVVNEGRFASRYFPGVGAWLAPFVSLGQPLWGQWLAGALASALFALAACEWGGLRAGWLAGMLISLCPGIILFGNLLLAHQPTLLGLGLFLWAWTLLTRKILRASLLAKCGYGLLAGIGLAFAALCRPMTAAGFCLPFALHWVYGWIRQQPWTGWPHPPARWFPAALLPGLSLAVPLACAAGVMVWYNMQVTGNPWISPYQQYTNVYTPRHVYGFNNRVRGERHLGPKVLENYDKWAENLTPALAVRNVASRGWASWQWTLGPVPLAMSLVAGLLLGRRQATGAWWALAAIVSLHAVHVPYWFDGILHWHYVFETAPLWVIWVALTLDRVWTHCARLGSPASRIWTLLLVGASIPAAYVEVPDVWTGRVLSGMSELRFARRKYAEFEALLNREVRRPALVLIEADPFDRHIDLVTNPPDLQAEVLRGRYLPRDISLEAVRRRFPGRTLYHYQAQTKRLRLITVPSSR